jgi:hypothetical protein
MASTSAQLVGQASKSSNQVMIYLRRSREQSSLSELACADRELAMWVVDFLNSNRLEAQAGAPYWKTAGVGVTGEVRGYFRIITYIQAG